MGRWPLMAARATAAVLLSGALSVAAVVALWTAWDSDSASVGVLLLAALVPPVACLLLVRPHMGAWFGGTLTAAWALNAAMLLAVLAAIAADGT